MRPGAPPLPTVQTVQTVQTRLEQISGVLGATIERVRGIQVRIDGAMPTGGDANVKLQPPSGINGWLMQVMAQVEILSQWVSEIDSKL